MGTSQPAASGMPRGGEEVKGYIPPIDL